uniref:Methyltransferase domain-containing protein n=1 Tax=Glossina palpalis gambiensis TaxID=67801 RepID=A0A1B0C4X2_9MUSC
MNDLMSFGMHRIWKNLLIKCNNTRPEHIILDLASGTGDITEKLSKLVHSGFIVSLDINNKMLKIGRNKLRNRGIMHPDQNKLKNMLLRSGFYSTEYFNILGGIVAIHKSYKF